MIKKIKFSDVFVFALWAAAAVWFCNEVRVAYGLFEKKEVVIKRIAEKNKGISENFIRYMQDLRERKLVRQKPQIDAINKYKKDHLSYSPIFVNKLTKENVRLPSFRLKTEKEITAEHKKIYKELNRCVSSENFTEDCKNKMVLAHNNCAEKLDDLYRIAIIDTTYRDEELRLFKELERALNNILLMQNIAEDNWDKQSIWDAFNYSCYLSYSLDKLIIQKRVFKL